MNRLKMKRRLERAGSSYPRHSLSRNRIRRMTERLASLGVIEDLADVRAGMRRDQYRRRTRRTVRRNLRALCGAWRCPSPDYLMGRVLSVTGQEVMACYLPDEQAVLVESVFRKGSRKVDCRVGGAVWRVDMAIVCTTMENHPKIVTGGAA